jgi:hypothetical protein
MDPISIKRFQNKVVWIPESRKIIKELKLHTIIDTKYRLKDRFN